MLVSLADHGLTPTVLAARLTHTGAPESLQGAVAAGLLGAGSVFLGPTGRHRRASCTPSSRPTGSGPRAPTMPWRTPPCAPWARCWTSGAACPGSAIRSTRQLDPRVPRLYEIAAEAGVLGPHLRLLEAVRAAHEQRSGRRLPINGAGAAGAALADLGLAGSARGFALLARVAGLLGHLAEEAERPLGPQLYRELDERMIYEPDPRDDGPR